MELLLSFVSAFIGGIVVYVFGVRKLSIEQRNRYIEKQMAEFYAPIAGYRKRIRSKSEVRLKVQTAASIAWREICDALPEPQPPGVEIERNAPDKRVIDYDSQQLTRELIPLYKKMLDVYTDKYWLADSDTRDYYSVFLEYVEIWDRYLADALPGDVVQKLNHSEEAVVPFYKHLEDKLFSLQAEIAAKNFLSQRL